MRARGEAVDDTLYLSWSNSLSRIMQRLGPAAQPPAPDYAAMLRAYAARRDGPEAA